MYTHPRTKRSHLLGALLVIAFCAWSAAPSRAATWLPHSLNFPTGITQEKLYTVSCASITSCTATGQDYNGIWGAHGETGAGSGWTPQAVTRNPPGGNKNGTLNGVSCVAPSVCLAAGGYGLASPPAPLGMTQVQGGASWSTTTIGTTGSQLTYNAASCQPSTTTPISLAWCMFVGYVMISGDDKPAARSYPSYVDRGAVTAPNATLLGVSCLSNRSCLAVGSTGTSPLAEWYDDPNGGKYTKLSTPPTPINTTGGKLTGVSCVSTSWCLVVGSANGVAGDTVPYGVEYSNGSWGTPYPTGLPSGLTQGSLYGVSCTSTTKCEAVGEASPGTKPFAAEWGGLGWSSSISVPLAPGAGGASLRGVSCISATHCEAAGWSLFGGTPTGLIETFS
jgi:hypothetical protein